MRALLLNDQSASALLAGASPRQAVKPMIYEIMYIIPSRYSDSEVEGVNTRVQALFTKHGATLVKSDNLGKIKLAYPIEKERYGTYLLAFIEMEGANLEKLNQDLILSDEVLRHVVVKREKGVPATYSIPDSYVAPLTSEGKRTTMKLKTNDAPKAPGAPVKESLSTAELDKKLDEILDSDIVSDV